MNLKILDPNLGNYFETKKHFDWNREWRELLGPSLADSVNLAELAVCRPIQNGLSDHVAIRHLNRKGDCKQFTYRDLDQLSDRVAVGLQGIGLKKQDRVFSLLGRVPETTLSALGALKAGLVFSPLYSSFGPDPIRTRMNLGDAKILITNKALYQQKVEKIRHEIPSLKEVVLIDAAEGEAKGLNAQSWGSFMSGDASRFEVARTHPLDEALLHFTSGTTGRPKGVMHAHSSSVMHYMTGKYALDFHPDDIFWCTADPGWVTGTSYGMFSPLLNGVTSVLDEQEFDPERWYRTLQEQQVSVWYTSPTAIRMLMKAGNDLPEKYDLSSLRLIGSVGEPLNAEAVTWGADYLGVPIHDNWWQTETGGIMISNFRGVEVKPGSMGLPLPGIEVILVNQSETGELREVTGPGKRGEIAIKAGWPAMFQNYLGEEGRYQRSFKNGYYLTGDLAKKDETGYFWFVGRSDDVIKSAGHLIGPFEVESVLMQHPEVAEAAVIGKPDPVALESVKAFVTLKKGHVPSEDLRLSLLALTRTRLGAAIAPKEIEFLDQIPHTRSGKVMRRLLRARELGLPEGDLSTLEGSA